MQKILVSACLLGIKVRYDGGDCGQNSVLLHKWLKLGIIVTICPEIAGDLPTPRPPSEIKGSKVITNLGIDDKLNDFSQLQIFLSIYRLTLTLRDNLHYREVGKNG